MPKSIAGTTIEEYIPHRGLNVLVDRVEFYSPEEAAGQNDVCVSGELSIAEGDARGRDLFLYTAADGSRCILEPALVEHLAVVSLSMLRERYETVGTAFFSTISNFKLESPAPAGETLRTSVRPSRSRGAFFGFQGSVKTNKERPVCSCDILAFYSHPSLGTAQTSGSGEKKQTRPPEPGSDMPVPVELFAFKRSPMTFIHHCVKVDRPAKEYTYRYVYPNDHPHVPGHFPSGAVMMGIAQWTSVADALHASAWAEKLIPGASAVTGSGEVIRADGTLVCEVNKLTLTYDAGGSTPVIAAAKKIGFRDMVRPDEEIFVRVRIET